MSFEGERFVATQWIPLICHPATPCAAVSGIEVQASRAHDGTLDIRYHVRGDIDSLVIPTERRPRRADGLWQHTCFEAFVASPASAGDAGYCEFNFSPSSEWAIYRFSAYRERVTPVQTTPPSISVHRDGTSITLAAAVRLDAMAVLGDGLQLALSAVIEDAQHHLSYWALAHPLGKPDFHHAVGFALELPGDKPQEPSSPSIPHGRAKPAVKRK